MEPPMNTSLSLSLYVLRMPKAWTQFTIGCPVPVSDKTDKIRVASCEHHNLCCLLEMEKSSIARRFTTNYLIRLAGLGNRVATWAVRPVTHSAVGNISRSIYKHKRSYLIQFFIESIFINAKLRRLVALTNDSMQNISIAHDRWDFFVREMAKERSEERKSDKENHSEKSC